MAPAADPLHLRMLRISENEDLFPSKAFFLDDPVDLEYEWAGDIYIFKSILLKLLIDLSSHAVRADHNGTTLNMIEILYFNHTHAS
ncbi:unknown [Blautia sp. CAG:237]|nr:unknown [Blautia sp. CAG:237]